MHHSALCLAPQGAAPTTVTVLWCKPLDESHAAASSFFHNLRFSPTIRLLHVPPKHVSGVPVKPVSTYFWALTVPDYLGAPELPLLIMEDDAVMTPNFGPKLAAAVHVVRVVAIWWCFRLVRCGFDLLRYVSDLIRSGVYLVRSDLL